MLSPEPRSHRPPFEHVSAVVSTSFLFYHSYQSLYPLSITHAHQHEALFLNTPSACSSSRGWPGARRSSSTRPLAPRGVPRGGARNGAADGSSRTAALARSIAALARSTSGTRAVRSGRTSSKPSEHARRCWLLALTTKSVKNPITMHKTLRLSRVADLSYNHPCCAPSPSFSLALARSGGQRKFSEPGSQSQSTFSETFSETSQSFRTRRLERWRRSPEEEANHSAEEPDDWEPRDTTNNKPRAGSKTQAGPAGSTTRARESDLSPLAYGRDALAAPEPIGKRESARERAAARTSRDSRARERAISLSPRFAAETPLQPPSR